MNAASTPYDLLQARRAGRMSVSVERRRRAKPAGLLRRTRQPEQLFASEHHAVLGCVGLRRESHPFGLKTGRPPVS
jgi:hypothetical protein